MVEHRLATGESLSADLIAQRGFTTNRKGFDPSEVKAFLASVADTVRDLRDQLRTSEAARKDAEHRALHPKIDEEMLMTAVGEETATILRTARAAAGDIRTRAEEQASALLQDAQARVDTISADADAMAVRVATEADESASALRMRAEEDADRTRALARQEAETTRQQADQERKMTVEAAQQIREQILSDLGRRRRVANTQIEQLRAGRERLLEAYLVVRRTLDEVTDELQRADGEARQAADEVAVRAAQRPSDDLLLDLMPGSSAPGPSSPPAAARSATGASSAPGPSSPPGLPSAPGPSSPPGSPPAPVAASPGSAAGSMKPADEPTIQFDALVLDDEPLVDPPELSAATGVAPADPVTGEAQDATAASPEGEASDPYGHDPSPGEPYDPSPGEPYDDAASSSDATPLSEQSTSMAGVSDSAVFDAPHGQMIDPPDEVESVRLVGSGTVASPPRIERPKAPARRGPGSSRGPVAKAQPDMKVLSEEVDEADPGLGGDTPGVDGIFARIRADRADALLKARSVLDEDVDPPDEATGPTTAEVVVIGPVTTMDPHATTGTAIRGAETAEDDDRPIPDGDEGVLQLRDEATADVEVALSRRLKRALQDEQNDLLDRLRQVRGTPKATNLLPKLAEQRGRYTTAARPHLEAAARAGVVFGAAFVSESEPEVATPHVDDLAVALAAAVTDPLRRRLQQAFGESAGDDQSVLIEALGAVYRECKTQRIEQLAGDHVAAAFSRGAFDATPEGTKMRWLVEDLGGPCPDCDDNELAGGVTKGEDFPTGQHYPPAHAGCRCVLVPTDE